MSPNNADNFELRISGVLIAYRGETKLELENLQAYLASLLRLENIGVLLGAGASVGAGGMTMERLWTHFVDQESDHAKWLHENEFINDENLPQKDEPGGALQSPNVEHLLDTLAIAIAEWTRVEAGKKDDALSARSAIYRSLIAASKLSDGWWESYGGPQLTENKLDDHRKLLQRLTSARQPGQASPWVFTTNYDLAVEWAADTIDLNVINGFLGVHSRKFSPHSFDLGYRNVHAHGEARFGSYNVYLAKLHGSLTWKEADGHFFEERASEAWPKLKSFENGDAKELQFTVLPSAAKYIQTVGFVLGELFRRFSEFLSRQQTAIIVSGYGFGDAHINRLLKTALLNPTLQLVVYCPEFTAIDQIDGLPDALVELMSLKNPRVTIVGGGAEAFFSGLVDHLPDPAIYNEDLKRLEERILGVTVGQGEAE